MSTPEVNPAVETHDLIAGMGNHEAKGLLLLHLGKSATMQTSFTMGKDFENFIGPGASWYPSTNTPIGYCAHSLEPIGQVLKGTVQSRRGESKAYGISEYGQAVGVPTAGLILEWSLDHPDVSVQQLFGPTHSTGDVRAPQNRILLLAELATSSQPSLSTVEIAGLNPADAGSQEYQNSLRTIDKASRSLAANGIVDIARREVEGNNRLFHINGIDPPVAAAPKRSAMTSTVHDFIYQRLNAGNLEFTAEEVVAYTVDTLPSEDPADIRTYITKMMALTTKTTNNATQYRCFPSVERLEVPFGNQHTQVTLNETYRQAVEALVEVIVSVDDRGPRTLRRGKAAAETISTDAAKKRRLIGKGYEFSAVAQKRSVAETMDAVVDILGKFDGPADTHTIHAAYAGAHSRPITEVTIQAVLRKLSEGKLVTQTKQRAKASSRKQRNFYQLTEE